jgi:hypothetical protein
MAALFEECATHDMERRRAREDGIEPEYNYELTIPPPHIPTPTAHQQNVSWAELKRANVPPRIIPETGTFSQSPSFRLPSLESTYTLTGRCASRLISVAYNSA